MSRNIFLYGTLRHVPLLETVLDRSAARLDLSPAQLPDHAVRSVKGADYPMIVEAPGERAEGLLVSGLDDEALERLDHYEGTYGYRLHDISVEAGDEAVPAAAYFSETATLSPVGDWALDKWVSRWGRRAAYAAAEVMAHYRTKSAEALDRIHATALVRADQKVRAEQEAPRGYGPPPAPEDVEVVTLRRPYADFFAIEEYDVRFRRFNGAMGPVVNRAIFVTSDSALVLPYDPERDRVLLIEQFRPALLARHDRAPWCLEPIAGRIDPGETPEQTAHREAREEAGLTLSALEPISRSYASPGNSTEFYHMYVGLAELPDDAAGVAGLAEENEDIRGHVMSFDEALALADGDQLQATPLVLAINWLARHRERLRGAA